MLGLCAAENRHDLWWAADERGRVLVQSLYCAQAIAAAQAALPGAAPPHLLLGADATEERLKLEMPRYAMLHLATPGFFWPVGIPSMWDQALDAVRQERQLCERSSLVSQVTHEVDGVHTGVSGTVFMNQLNL